MKKTKNLLAIVAMMLLVAMLSVAGTMAWLAASTDTIENTFTVGNIDITLTESTGTDYNIIPGTILRKDPTVTVIANSEPCYVFIKVDNTLPVTDDIVWSLNSGWTLVEEAEDGDVYVWNAIVNTSSADQYIEVLTGSQIAIGNGLTKHEVDQLAADGYKMEITAYAVQSANVADADAAWAIAKSASWYNNDQEGSTTADVPSNNSNQ